MATTKAIAKETTTSKVTTEKNIVEAPAKKEAVKKEPVKKTPAKKAPAKKTAAKKAPAKRATAASKVSTEVYVQFAGHEVSQESLLERVKEAWVAEGNKATAIKSVSLYVKPEEYKAYYVVNGSAAGALDI